MAYRLVKFEAWHMLELQHTGLEHWLKGVESTWKRLEDHNSFTLLQTGDDPKVLACGGTIEGWPGRHQAWFYNIQATSRIMGRMTKLTAAILANVKGRIEATVEVDFKQGHKWMKLLGFEIENPPGILKQYGPGGEDHVSYVRFNL